MPRNGSGTYAPPAGQPVVTNTVVSASTFNALVADLSVELTKSISTDGQTPMAAALPMGNNKITGLATGTLPTDAVRLDQVTVKANSADLAASTGAGLLGWIRSAVGAVFRWVSDKLSDTVSVFDFMTAAQIADVRSSTGALDVTAAVLAAITHCTLVGKILYFPAGTYKLTGVGLAIPAQFPGMIGEGIWRTQLYYNGTGTAITLAGTGSMGVYRDFSVFAGSVGDTVITARTTARNGIYWKCYGGGAEISNVKAWYFNGSGHKFEAIWDSTLSNLITDSCGSAAEYAISMINGTDTSNHTTINRIQAESSYTKAMYLNGVNNVITEIHSERTTGNGIDYTHIFEGDITLLSGRIEATSNVYVRIGIANGSMKNIKFNTGNVDFTWGSRAINAALIEGCGFAGNVSILGSNLRHYKFVDCNLGGNFSSAYVEKETTLTHSLVAGSTTLTGNGAKLVLRDGSTLSGAFVLGGGNNTIEIYDSDSVNFPPFGSVKVRNATFTNAYGTAFGQQIAALDCTFNGLITIGNSSVKWKSDNSNYAAGITLGAGSPGWAFGSRDYVGGAVSAGFNANPLGGTWSAGERSYTLPPTVGQPKSRACTAAGTPGSWASEGNL